MVQHRRGSMQLEFQHRVSRVSPATMPFTRDGETGAATGWLL